MSSQKKKSFFFYIDVVGSCNLRCPSCPVGNSPEVANPNGFMKLEVLEEIMQKATKDCDVTGVGLFNWTEPLLHPQLPELVKIVQSYQVPCHLSSNLNILKNIDNLLEANPNSLRISTSGFTQSVYGITHKGGDIERVKRNMVTLAEAKQRTKSTTAIHVLYHRYKGNLDEELLMKKFTERLNFDFYPVWAFMMPLEKVLDYATNGSNSPTLSQQDYKLINHLALPLDNAISASQRYKSNSCPLQTEQITLDYQGNVQLCCALYDSQKYSLAPYVSTPIEQIQRLKLGHDMCSQCTNLGLHMYVTYGVPEFDKIAKQNLYHYYQELGLDFHDIDGIILINSLVKNHIKELVEFLKKKVPKSWKKSIKYMLKKSSI